MRPVLLLLIFSAVSMTSWTVQAETMVNPHWTGMHCGECHKNNALPALLSGGDINALCNRCHGPGSEARFEVHQVDIAVPEQMKSRLPAGWPLADGKLSCLTCHDIQSQMHENVLGRVFNINFLRPAQPPGDSICFTCHERSRFEQPNPHKLMITQQGVLNNEACLQCHQELPDIETATEIKDAPLPTIMADPMALESVYGNLITNAINYTQTGGEIKVLLDMAGTNVRVIVKDNGYGIDAKYMDKIFEKFYRVKNENTRFITGTGLGLPIVKGIVDSLGGYIDVESETGKGTAFTVLLPIK